MVCSYEAASGKLFDFFNSIIIGFNYDISDLYMSYKTDLDIDPDMVAQDAFERIWEGIDRQTPGLATVLTYFRDKESYLEWVYERQLPKLGNVKAFIDLFKSVPKKDFAVSLLSYFDEAGHEKDFYENLLNDNVKLFTFIDSVNTTENIKWEILKLINKPEPILKELLGFFSTVSKRLDKVYDKNAFQLKQFEAYVNERIASQGGGFFLLDDCPGLDDKIDSKKLGTVIITACIMSRNIIFTRDCGNEFRVYLSLNYKDLIEKQFSNDGWYNLRLMLRALSDETRHGMYKLLIGKEMYLTEIAETLNASISTTVHHLDILHKASVIMSFDKGKKRYYTVNVKQMEQYVKMFSEYYKN